MDAKTLMTRLEDAYSATEDDALADVLMDAMLFVRASVSPATPTEEGT